MVWKTFAASAFAASARDLALIAATPKAPPLIAGHPSSLQLRDAHIDPSWIIAGEPKARLAEHSRAVDGAAATAVWECTAGEFRWFFAWDETVVILEGGVHVTAEDGSERALKAGDIAYFKANSWATWKIDTYVKKIAFVRRPFPAFVANAWRAFKNLRQAARGAQPQGASLH